MRTDQFHDGVAEDVHVSTRAAEQAVDEMLQRFPQMGRIPRDMLIGMAAIRGPDRFVGDCRRAAKQNS